MERDELHAKAEKLTAFLESDPSGVSQRQLDLMTAQAAIMAAYAAVLEARLREV
jgi:hypothetical protein